MVKESQETSSSSSTSDRQNVSFKFTKTTSKSLSGNKLAESSSESKDFVLSVDKSEIKSTNQKYKPKALVIPLIRKNTWRTSDTITNKNDNKEATLEELAVQEILRETSEKNAEWEKREAKDFNRAIPLIMQNKVPDGFETDDKLDVSLRANESTLDDYEKVPIEEYGLAMLRGMGWKEGQAIGNKNQVIVEPVKVELRPKGLGLGADASVLKKSQKKAKEEKLELVKGAYVNIIQGRFKGFYGQILSLDEENARAFIKLSTEEEVKTFPEFFFNLVSKKEFDKESRILNRAAYENYKREKEIKEEELSREQSEKKRKHRHQRTNSREDERDSYRTEEEEARKSKKHSKKRRHSKDRSEKSSSSNKSKQIRIWVRPQLRVRFIDERYKKGKYFNKKMIIMDVLSQDCCSCKTEDDRAFLDDISPSMLETVIPRDESAHVMIVRGKYSGELCTILKKDKSQCVATVQFLSDRSQALKIEYNSICEYVGDVTQFD